MKVQAKPLAELQFRIYDGTVICRAFYSRTLTIRECKQMLVNQWPEDREIFPRSVKDLELIFNGKVLKNRKTLAQYKIIYGVINVTLKDETKKKTGMGACPSIPNCFSCATCLAFH